MVLMRRKAPELHREWGRADQIAAPEAPAAPATVSGEGPPMPLGRKAWEGGKTRSNREPGDRPCEP